MKSFTILSLLPLLAHALPATPEATDSTDTMAPPALKPDDASPPSATSAGTPASPATASTNAMPAAGAPMAMPKGAGFPQGFPQGFPADLAGFPGLRGVNPAKATPVPGRPGLRCEEIPGGRACFSSVSSSSGFPRGLGAGNPFAGFPFPAGFPSSGAYGFGAPGLPSLNGIGGKPRGPGAPGTVGIQISGAVPAAISQALEGFIGKLQSGEDAEDVIADMQQLIAKLQKAGARVVPEGSLPLGAAGAGMPDMSSGDMFGNIPAFSGRKGGRPAPNATSPMSPMAPKPDMAMTGSGPAQPLAPAPAASASAAASPAAAAEASTSPVAAATPKTTA